MELSINRLKVLGHQELENIDKQIQIFKDTNKPVLNETLDELRKKLEDSNDMLSSIKSEYVKKESLLNLSQSNLEKK